MNMKKNKITEGRLLEAENKIKKLEAEIKEEQQPGVKASIKKLTSSTKRFIKKRIKNENHI